MIESIDIKAHFPFLEFTKLHLKKINYFFGVNGAGKTTISRIIANESKYEYAQINWEKGVELDTFVLNRDFVEQNFGQLKGVFTLGKDNKELHESIQNKEKKLDEENQNLEDLKVKLNGTEDEKGKRKELEDTEKYYKELFWDKTRKYTDLFRDAFEGTLASKVSFKEKLLKEYIDNHRKEKSFEDIKSQASILFGTKKEHLPIIEELSYDTILSLESNPVLKKPVIGKEDVDIADMIARLGNSDWVKQGRVFYDRNYGTCPFCQQKTIENFSDNLEAYFDESYRRETDSINSLLADYKREAKVIKDKITRIINSSRIDEFLDAQKLRDKKNYLSILIDGNIDKLKVKKAAPSTKIMLEPLEETLKKISEICAEGKDKIKKHNELISRYEEERKGLIKDVWHYIKEDLKSDISKYVEKTNFLNRYIEDTRNEIQEIKKRIEYYVDCISNLKLKTTTILTTAEKINAILKKFGFTSFQLDVSEDKLYYKILRSNGEPAANTLSEGEKTFLVFLYFYSLIKGAPSVEGIDKERIVVFDDPVSSLDSEVLFIISSLIRSVCEEACRETSKIKQVIVLTHNIYFHREVAFRAGKPPIQTKELAFYIIRKKSNGSSIKAYHRKNPIKTSYELLWDEVRDACPNNIGLPNTMRRILEYYFNLMGNTKLHLLERKFEGQDKLICRSLLSWAHSGSHNIFDSELYVPSDIEIAAYCKTFKDIFEKHGHIEHYNLMMKIN